MDAGAQHKGDPVKTRIMKMGLSVTMIAIVIEALGAAVKWS